MLVQLASQLFSDFVTFGDPVILLHLICVGHKQALTRTNTHTHTSICEQVEIMNRKIESRMLLWHAATPFGSVWAIQLLLLRTLGQFYPDNDGDDDEDNSSNNDRKRRSPALGRGQWRLYAIERLNKHRQCQPLFVLVAVASISWMRHVAAKPRYNRHHCSEL